MNISVPGATMLQMLTKVRRTTRFLLDGHDEDKLYLCQILAGFLCRSYDDGEVLHPDLVHPNPVTTVRLYFVDNVVPAVIASYHVIMIHTPSLMEKVCSLQRGL